MLEPTSAAASRHLVLRVPLVPHAVEDGADDVGAGLIVRPHVEVEADAFTDLRHQRLLGHCGGMTVEQHVRGLLSKRCVVVELVEPGVKEEAATKCPADLAPVGIAGRHRSNELSLAEVKVQPMANVIIRMFTRDLDSLSNQRLVSIVVGRGVKFQGRNEGSTEVQVLVPDEQFQ